MRLNSFPPDVGVLLLRKYTLLKIQTNENTSRHQQPPMKFRSKSTRPRDVRTMDLSSQWWNATLILRIFFSTLECWLCQRSRTNHRQLTRLTRSPMAYAIVFFFGNSARLVLTGCIQKEPRKGTIDKATKNKGIECEKGVRQSNKIRLSIIVDCRVSAPELLRFGGVEVHVYSAIIVQIFIITAMILISSD